MDNGLAFVSTQVQDNNLYRKKNLQRYNLMPELAALEPAKAEPSSDALSGSAGDLGAEARKIAKDLELSEASTILDIGCGTGIREYSSLQPLYLTDCIRHFFYCEYELHLSNIINHWFSEISCQNPET